MNIVLIGRSGVGKSTWINSFFNYILHPSFDSAVREGPVYAPTYSRFKHNDQEAVVNKEDDFGCLVDIQVGDENQKNVNAEYRKGNTSVSATMFPMAHRLEPRDSELGITLIDTPGFGSTCPDGDASISGVQDKQNINLILNQLGRYPHIDAFVILLKPGQEKLDPGFATYLKTLFSQLDKSAKNNVIFSFTHSKSCNFNDIEHLPALKSFLMHQVNLIIKPSNVFYFDNSPFRYIAIASNNYQPTENRDQMQYCWDRSVKDCIKMLMHINNLAAHKTDTIVAINDSKAIIKMIIAPLVFVCKINEENYALVKQTFENLAQKTGRSVIKVKENPVIEKKPDEDEKANEMISNSAVVLLQKENVSFIAGTDIDAAVGGKEVHNEDEAHNEEAMDHTDRIEIKEKILTYKKLKKPITVCNNPACFKKQRIKEVSILFIQDSLNLAYAIAGGLH